MFHECTGVDLFHKRTGADSFNKHANVDSFNKHINDYWYYKCTNAYWYYMRTENSGRTILHRSSLLFESLVCCVLLNISAHLHYRSTSAYMSLTHTCVNLYHGGFTHWNSNIARSFMAYETIPLIWVNIGKFFLKLLFLIPSQYAFPI